MIDLAQELTRVRIVPVIVIRNAAHAVPLACALRDGGLSVLEVTLRTPDALMAVRQIRREVSGVRVGAGSVLDRRQLAAAADAGADFAVSPGFTEDVAAAAVAHDLPLLPGVATASEVMQGLAAGFSLFKFFPAEVLGGVAALRALGGPFPHVRFCPTGGVNVENLLAYLALENVIAVGGSWMIPADLTAEDAFAMARALATAAGERASA
jgi:2-dehydro-3-deoxyphosphogluconate aldolase / (4S)-4-hydroxy-2-oxoglutarate aldolase